MLEIVVCDDEAADLDDEIWASTKGGSMWENCV